MVPKEWIRILLALALVTCLLILVRVFDLANLMLIENKYIYAILILLAGIVITSQVKSIIVSRTRAKLGNRAFVIANSVEVFGYIISLIFTLLYLGPVSEALLAGATFSGLIIGLAAQPILGNFFSGLLILSTGMLRPGTEVTILTWHIPFQLAFLPGYKYFSPDSVYAGYKGIVLEVGLFYTRIQSVEGQVIKVPNTILATDAGIVDYTSEKDYFFNVRYEFPVKYDPKVVLPKIKNILKDLPVLNVRINEQSDKDYYIVKIILNAKGQDHAELKSDILTRLIGIHKELKDSTNE